MTEIEQSKIKKPAVGSSMRDVVAAVVQEGGCYMICKRAAGKIDGGLWEFPGGKLEPGETAAEALCRELKEELNVKASVTGEDIFVARNEEKGIKLRFFRVSIEGTPELSEHQDIAWVAEDKLAHFQMCATDRLFVQRFLMHKE